MPVVIYQQIKIYDLQNNQPYLASDKKAIRLAFNTFMQETGSSKHDVRNRFPVVVNFGNARCVALMIPKDSIGRIPVYCFDMDYRKVRFVRTDVPEVVDTRPESYGR